jgi:hypothetical protein
MTRWEILEMLSEWGIDSAADYNDGLHGWFGWKVSFKNGDAVLTVWFTDADTDEVTEFEWALNAREVQ